MDKNLLNQVNQYKTITEILDVANGVFNLIVTQGEWTSDFFLHPLGFHYCRLYHDENHQVRLHIWEKNYPVKEDLYIHDHFYDLCSWVLCGEIMDYSYEVKAINEKSDYCMFISSYLSDKNVRTIKKTETFLSVKKNEGRIIKKNQKYTIERETFHSNQILFGESDLTVTIVYTFNHKKNNSPHVVGLHTNDGYYEGSPNRISSDKVKALITEAKHNIWGN